VWFDVRGANTIFEKRLEAAGLSYEDVGADKAVVDAAEAALNTKEATRHLAKLCQELPQFTASNFGGSDFNSISTIISAAAKVHEHLRMSHLPYETVGTTEQEVDSLAAQANFNMARGMFLNIDSGSLFHKWALDKYLQASGFGYDALGATEEEVTKKYHDRYVREAEKGLRRFRESGNPEDASDVSAYLDDAGETYESIGTTKEEIEPVILAGLKGQ